MAKAKLGSGKRFKAFVDKVQGEGYDEQTARKIAAAAGRKKYGKGKMAKMAAAGRRRKSK